MSAQAEPVWPCARGSFWKFLRLSLSRGASGSEARDGAGAFRVTPFSRKGGQQSSQRAPLGSDYLSFEQQLVRLLHVGPPGPDTSWGRGRPRRRAPRGSLTHPRLMEPGPSPAAGSATSVAVSTRGLGWRVFRPSRLAPGSGIVATPGFPVPQQVAEQGRGPRAGPFPLAGPTCPLTAPRPGTPSACPRPAQRRAVAPPPPSRRPPHESRGLASSPRLLLLSRGQTSPPACVSWRTQTTGFTDRENEGGGGRENTPRRARPGTGPTPARGPHT